MYIIFSEWETVEDIADVIQYIIRSKQTIIEAVKQHGKQVPIARI